MHIFIMILQVIFIIGVIGCCITIPVAAWGYISVLFERDTDAERGMDEEAKAD